MIEEIIRKWKRTKYDFRKQANPDDPLKHLFEEWVDYYKLKSAIASVIKPKKVLEIGVRFGYSAFAFFDGYPRLHYTGIDLDSDSFGGVKGAVNWARAKLPPKRADIIIADSQALSEFPGGEYDLIHVDGQQDGYGSFHDLEIAVRQSRFILVDGFFWTRQNFQSVSEFLIKNKELIEYYFVIPGYAGELIIRIKDVFRQQLSKIPSVVQGSDISGSCDSLGPFEETRGKQILESRLSSILDIGLMSSPRSAICIGYGRGEIVYQLAKRGIATAASGYSDDAIQIARSRFDGEQELWDKVEWLGADPSRAKFSTKYDLVIAGDIVEHMTSAELDALCSNVSSSMNDNARFVVHTFPSEWFSQYGYERKRSKASSPDAYLPRDPRSRHEEEQSPRVLKKQLSKYFKHVVLWLGCPENPLGTLGREVTADVAGAYRDTYAVASNSPIDITRIISVLDMNPLPESEASRISWEVVSSPETARPSSRFKVSLRVVNLSNMTISSYGPHPVKMSYHWISAKDGETIVFDGERTILAPSQPPGTEEVYEMTIASPSEAGDYILQARIVQEMVRWHDSFATQKADISIRIDTPIRGTGRNR